MMMLPNRTRRDRQFANVLNGIVTHETENMRWLRLAAEKLELDRARGESE